MISDQEKRNAWLSFASAALAGSADALADADISLEDIGEDACALADGMLDAYLAKFESEEEPSPKRRKRG